MGTGWLGVANLLAVWRTHGLDAIMKEAWDKGIVLAGISAGSICWHAGGTTDSFGKDLQPITNSLGLLPYANGVHYDGEEQRRPLLQKLVSEGVFSEAYATDDGVAIHYINEDFHRAISDTPDKFAYHLTVENGEVVERKLETEVLELS